MKVMFKIQTFNVMCIKDFENKSFYIYMKFKKGYIYKCDSELWRKYICIDVFFDEENFYTFYNSDENYKFGDYFIDLKILRKQKLEKLQKINK